MSPSFSRRSRILQLLFILVFIIFTIRLFELQVLEHERFYEEARAQHEKRSVFPARRGKILVRKNRLTDDTSPLATNNTLKMMFVDPVILAYPHYNEQKDLGEQEKGNPLLAAELLAPLLIHAHCEKIEGCEVETDPEQWSPTQKAAIEAYKRELQNIFTEIERTRVILATDVAPSRAEAINALQLSGISMQGSAVIANPTQITDVKNAAKQLSPLLNVEEDEMEQALERRLKRYVKITNKIVPEVSDEIMQLKQNPRYRMILRGVQLRDEHWRFYPEKTLLAQILGYVNNAGSGQYGIEGRFDHLLRGKEGYILGATNTRGKRIWGKDSNIIRARDGADILLTIDRVAQGAIEKILAEDTERFDADFGQVIVVEPKTGRIIAMAHYPTFDPNKYGKALERYEITPEQEQADREDETFNQRIPTIIDESRYYRYFNKWGGAVYRNKLVADIYEPGSVMKAITMASALNADEVTPETTYEDTGPIEVEGFSIRNADGVYAGTTTMISVLNRSLNTGIAFITRKMGTELVYKYFREFGFGQYTDIELDGEEEGIFQYWKDWSESELITQGFGQGISITPVQMVMAFSALANGGYLMKPIIVEEIRYTDGTRKTYQPERIRRVISDETYHTIKAMLQNAVSYGAARTARVYGYSIMGKTGTSQTYKGGKALVGEGTTITSFAGFGPFKDPQFVVLVKYDYPKVSQWGSETAAVTFSKIAEFLFQHYGIPPDR